MSNIQIIYKSNFHPIKIIKNYITNSFDAWEQRKLGVLGSVAMNKRIFKEETSDNGEIPFYKFGTFGGVSDAFISRELFEEYKSKYPYPTKGDLLISASGSKQYIYSCNLIYLHILFS